MNHLNWLRLLLNIHHVSECKILYFSSFVNIFFSISGKFPNLEKLIFCINYKSYDAYRWQLLQWMFRFDDKFITALRHLSHFDKKFIAVIITLRYLLQVNIKTNISSDFGIPINFIFYFWKYSERSNIRRRSRRSIPDRTFC